MAAPRSPHALPLNPPPEPPPVTDAMARAHRRYWRFNVALILVLMAIGFFVSFVVPTLSRPLSAVWIAGFRLPFYLGAQGAIVIYLVLIVVYIVLMQRADRTLRRAFDADSANAANADSATETAR
jgi:putative solute:sodium symporter small subunit